MEKYLVYAKNNPGEAPVWQKEFPNYEEAQQYARKYHHKHYRVVIVGPDRDVKGY